MVKLISVMLPGASRSVLHKIVVAKLISVPDAFQVCAAQNSSGKADISDAAWCFQVCAAQDSGGKADISDAAWCFQVCAAQDNGGQADISDAA